MKNHWKYFYPVFEYKNELDDADSAWAGHEYFVYDLIRNLEPGVIVELGTHQGHSFFAMCQALKDAGLTSKVIAVDTWTGDEHAGFYGQEVYETVLRICQKVYPGVNTQLIKKAFDAAAGDFKRNSVDLLHIDGLHTYEAVKHDFDTWFDIVKPDGIILLHDTIVNAEGFGVWKLWEELRGSFNHLDFVHAHGLGAIFKDRATHDNLSAYSRDWQIYYELLSRDAESDKIIREADEEISQLFFANVRKAAEQEHIMRELQSRMHDLEGEIAILKLERDTLNQHISLMKNSRTWRLRGRFVALKKSLGRISLHRFFQA